LLDPLSETCEPIDVTEMNIGKWYDPISEQWIVPRETRTIAGYGQPSAEQGPDAHERGETQRIWDLLVDCCASG
jgi:hypothetical protein